MTKELIEEALRWANGHPNRRASELMRALADALAAERCHMQSLAKWVGVPDNTPSLEIACEASAALEALEARQPSEDDREATEAEIDKAAGALHMAKCCSLSGDSPHDFPEASEVFAAGVVLNAVPRAAVPDAANRELTEAIRLTVEYVGNDMLPAIEGWDWYDALVKYAPEVAQAFVDKPIHFPKPTDADAERDAALAAVERIRRAVSGHPECDRYEEGDVISCGWKSAYASVVAALDGAPEPEWEYGLASRTARIPNVIGVSDNMPLRDEFGRAIVRRRKAGPWEPVEGEQP